MNQITINKNISAEDMQTILYAMKVAGGGTVFFEPGVYAGEGLNVPAGVKIDGKKSWFRKFIESLTNLMM